MSRSNKRSVITMSVVAIVSVALAVLYLDARAQTISISIPTLYTYHFNDATEKPFLWLQVERNGEPTLEFTSAELYALFKGFREALDTGYGGP